MPGMLNIESFHRARRLSSLTYRRWVRRFAFWGGAVMVGLFGVGFARISDQAGLLQQMIYHRHPLAMLALTPLVTGFGVWLTLSFFLGAGGSGIPQVIAVIELDDPHAVARLLPLRSAIGKFLITVMGLFGGLSIGREGPTVQIAATLMAVVGRWARLPAWVERRALIVAGGAAGVAAAFNTPLAGVVFAIEELTRSFETRTSGLVLTSVILAGITSLALVGNYTYFGSIPADLSFGAGWWCVLITGVCGGAVGGLFSRTLIAASQGRIGAILTARPVLTAVLIGLAVAGIGLGCHGASFGTGYGAARALLGGAHMPWYYFPAKFLVTVLSYITGVPGGIFAPSLSVGAAMGDLLSHVVPGAPAGTVVLLGMAAYFTGVVQAPITGIVIVMEMTNNQQLAMPIMAASMIALLTSRLICRQPLYSALAERFKVAYTQSGRGQEAG